VSSNPTKRVSSTRAVVIATLLSLASIIVSEARAQSVSEDSVKAAFLYRFTEYVDWPQPALQSAQFTIAVLDDSHVAEELEHVVTGHQVKGRTPKVKLVHRAREATDAQIVFMGSGDEDAHRRFIAGLNGRPVLIVTDEEHGLEEGSTVNFMLVDHRLRFEISLTAAARSGLKISSELLSVAARVEGHLNSNADCRKLHCPLTVAGQ
jgi:YfiR/HmsC-like